MKVIVEPRFPVRGILASPISTPTRLDLSPMQIKRCILSDAKVYEELEGGKKKEISINDISEYAGRSTVVKLANGIIDAVKEGVKDPLQGKKYHGIELAGDEVHEATMPVADKKDTSPHAAVDPYKGMTKAERRRARREAEQRAAEEAKAAAEKDAAEETPVEEVSAEQIVEEAIATTVEEVEQSAEEASGDQITE